jgi:hypothetical protein
MIPNNFIYIRMDLALREEEAGSLVENVTSEM